MGSCESGGVVGVRVDDTVDVRAVTVDVKMAGGIGGRFVITFDDIPIQIDDHHGFWGQVFELDARWFDGNVSRIGIPNADIAIRPGHQVMAR